MTLGDIVRLPVNELAASHLYLWSTAKMHRSGAAVDVAETWGFKVVGEIIWAKPNFGMGAFPRPQHEVMLVCRADATPFTRNDVGTVQTWPQVYANNGAKSHSQKPAASFDLIESASPGPYVELFARQPRLGWDHWGLGIEGAA
jgi:N6-adenosine-specific RNA methylase IME4